MVFIWRKLQKSEFPRVHNLHSEVALMVLGAISLCGVGRLAFRDGHSEKYKDALQTYTYILPLTMQRQNKVYPINVQDHNSPVHTANRVSHSSLD